MKHQPDDLEERVANRKSQLITEIIEHKKNSSRPGAADAIYKLNDRLTELSTIMKTAEPTKLTVSARTRLTEWMAR